VNPTQPKGRMAGRAAPKRGRPVKTGVSGAGRSRVVALAPRRRERDTERQAAHDGVVRCPKCQSAWVVLEPAFLHCRYCGALNRIPQASLEAQEEFEIRSGLRLAS
jgi:hypothetical protein